MDYILNTNPGDFVITESWYKFCFCNVVKYRQHSLLYLQKNNSLSFEIQLQLWQNDVADNKDGVGNNKHLVLGYEEPDTRAVSAGTSLWQSTNSHYTMASTLTPLFIPEQHKHYLTITVLPSVCCMFYLTLNCFPCNAVCITCRLLYTGRICTDPVERFWLRLAWHIPPRIITKISTSYFYYMLTYGCQDGEILHFIIWILKIYQKAQYPSCYIQ